MLLLGVASLLLLEYSTITSIIISITIKVVTCSVTRLLRQRQAKAHLPQWSRPANGFPMPIDYKIMQYIYTCIYIYLYI